MWTDSRLRKPGEGIEIESTLSLAKKDLEAEVGLNLGWGRGAEFGETPWDPNKQNAINSCVRSGLRQFYFPPPMQGVSYDWSFLKPIVTLTLASSGSTVELPDDFGGLEGGITWSSSGNANFWPLHVGGEGRVRQAFTAFPEASGRPEMAAVRPKKMLNELNGQRHELYVYPSADTDFTLQLQYYLLPNALDGSRAYAYGGMAHAETILESCLSIAEQRFDDKVGGHSAKFMERLAASINHDRRNKPQRFGYNGDRSDDYGMASRRFWMDQTITIGGVAP